MRFIGLLLLSTMLPTYSLAAEMYIRIEAKRTADAAEMAATSWRETFDNVVTFPLNGGWTGIALGPLDEEQAADDMALLKAEGKIPNDSILAPAADITPGTETSPAPTEPVTPSDYFIRVQSFADQDQAEAALTEWRETFAKAGLWQIADGGFAIALGPMSEQSAKDWLGVLKSADAVPRDALIQADADLGEALDQGETSEWPASPDTATPLPPLEETQELMRWAGHYDGDIDGKNGPQTRAALAQTVASLRISPDAGTSLVALRDQREAWRSDMGLTMLQDDHTGLGLIAPVAQLEFDRSERSLSIYGPKEGSGAALILMSQDGGRQEMLDLAGLITALGWVPSPKREIGNRNIHLLGSNDAHIGQARAEIVDGMVQGYVLIWPSADPLNADRLAREIDASLTRMAAPMEPSPAKTGAEAEPTPTSALADPHTSP